MASHPRTCIISSAAHSSCCQAAPGRQLCFQERLEELRQKGEAGDRHDSTLGGFDEPATAQQRAAKADGHLKKFLAGLDKLKQQGQQVPGLDGLDDLLKDPRKDGAHLRVCSV